MNHKQITYGAELFVQGLLKAANVNPNPTGQAYWFSVVIPIQSDSAWFQKEKSFFAYEYAPSKEANPELFLLPLVQVEEYLKRWYPLEHVFFRQADKGIPCITLTPEEAALHDGNILHAEDIGYCVIPRDSQEIPFG